MEGGDLNGSRGERADPVADLETAAPVGIRDEITSPDRYARAVSRAESWPCLFARPPAAPSSTQDGHPRLLPHYDEVVIGIGRGLDNGAVGFLQDLGSW